MIKNRPDWLGAFMMSNMDLSWNMQHPREHSMLSLLGWAIEDVALDTVRFLIDVFGFDIGYCGVLDNHPKTALMKCIEVRHWDPQRERAQQELLCYLVHHPLT